MLTGERLDTNRIYLEGSELGQDKQRSEIRNIFCTIERIISQKLVTKCCLSNAAATRRWRRGCHPPHQKTLPPRGVQMTEGGWQVRQTEGGTRTGRGGTGPRVWE